MSELKIFRGNWDGKRERAVVCATKKRAMELLGATASTMKGYFSHPSTVIREEDSVVWTTPETVFQRPIAFGPNRPAWMQVEAT